MRLASLTRSDQRRGGISFGEPAICPVTSVLDPASAVGQGERREPAADVRLDGDEMIADPDDGDARSCFSGRAYIILSIATMWLCPR
jgi:hypothetical protein